MRKTFTHFNLKTTLAIGGAFFAANIFAQTASDIIISEYVEGSSNNKAIEIFNGTGTSIDLSHYSLKKQSNGAGEFKDEYKFTGTLENGKTFVLANSSASNSLKDFANALEASVTNFNGNDAVALYKDGVQIDIVGTANSTANWGKDVTLRRNSNILSPSTTYSAVDWETAKIDSFDDLGKHTLSADEQLRGPSFEVVAPAGYLVTDPLMTTLGYSLSINNPNEKGKILFSTTDAEPTTEYTKEIILTDVATISAKVVDGDKESAVATYKVNAIGSDRVSKDGLPGLLAGDKSATLYSGVANAPVQLLFNTANKYYITSPETGAYTLVFSNGFLPTEAKEGDIFNTNFICLFEEYQSTPQIVKVQHFVLPELTGEEVAFAPKAVAINDILLDYAAYQHNFITIKGVKFDNNHQFDAAGDVDARTGTVKDADNKGITIYDSFKTLSANVSTDKTYDITGFVGRYKDTYQIFPRSNDDIVETSPTGIENTTVANLTISTTKGAVVINTTEAASISIYTIAGQLVKATTVEAGSTIINLSEGVYVVAGKKVVIL